MIVNLFSVPILIGNINLDRVKITHEKFTTGWVSATKTSHGQNNIIDPESHKYLAKTFGTLLKTLLRENLRLKITAIWENVYEKDDFQEPHVHALSHFSFIIYKEVTESQTVFFHPGKNAIQCLETINYFETHQKLPLCKGQFVIFPSFLEHMVLKSSNQKTISGNIRVEAIK
jgi:hypothetical protein|tara:strand:+ start:104 stop:622 length:519 start_codon:yes stop_codon:yes gene_type:complete